jgi:hypothetical protein
VAAFLRFDPANPYATRFVDEDFNRVWTPAEARRQRAQRRAGSGAAAAPFVDAPTTCWTSHSMLEPSPRS